MGGDRQRSIETVAARGQKLRDTSMKRLLPWLVIIVGVWALAYHGPWGHNASDFALSIVLAVPVLYVVGKGLRFHGR